MNRKQWWTFGLAFLGLGIVFYITGNIAFELALATGDVGLSITRTIHKSLYLIFITLGFASIVAGYHEKEGKAR